MHIHCKKIQIHHIVKYFSNQDWAKTKYLPYRQGIFKPRLGENQIFTISSRNFQNKIGQKPNIYHIVNEFSNQDWAKTKYLPYRQGIFKTRLGENQIFTISSTNFQNKIGRKPNIYHIVKEFSKQDRAKTKYLPYRQGIS